MHMNGNSQAAIGAVCGRLVQDFPDDTVEALMTFHGKCLQEPQTVPVTDLQPVLEEWVKQFPHAVTHYDRTGRYGCVSLIWCDCNETISKDCPRERTACQEGADTPRITILMCTRDNKAVRLG